MERLPWILLGIVLGWFTFMPVLTLISGLFWGW